MRQFPPGDGTPARRIPGVARVGATARAPRRDADLPGSAPELLIRTVTMSGAQARAHLARWASETPARDVAAPRGVTARERSRPDRVRPGVTWRQRVAMAVAGDAATVVHWSAPEPPTAADERAWGRLLARLAGAPSPDNGRG